MSWFGTSLFTHIIQGYITGTGQLYGCPSDNKTALKQMNWLISSLRKFFIFQKYLVGYFSHFHIWRCHRSSAAVTPVKYECDIQMVTSVLTMVKNRESDRTEEIGLVTPTGGLWCSCYSIPSRSLSVISMGDWYTDLMGHQIGCHQLDWTG